jgi:hypothetical protein
MGILAAVVLLLGSVVIWSGPEARGIAFGKAAEAAQPVAGTFVE